MTTASSPAAGGFVRVPQSWVFLPISPQSKSLLLALCAFADGEGRSWCSFEQLGGFIGRSKASVSAYLEELRTAGLVRCKQQRYGNGYNYRLLVTLEGWADLLAHWSDLAKAKAARTRASMENASPPANGTDTPLDRRASTSQPSERRVQHAERKDPKGPITHLHETQTVRARCAEKSGRGAVAPAWTREDEAEWRRFRPSDRDPPSVTGRAPSPELLEKVIALAGAQDASAGILEPGEARRASRDRLVAFARRRGVDLDKGALDEAAERLARMAPTGPAVDAAIGALEACWQAHWRRLPSPAQLERSCSDAAGAALRTVRTEDALRARSRAWIARIALSRLQGRPPASRDAPSPCRTSSRSPHG